MGVDWSAVTFIGVPLSDVTEVESVTEKRYDEKTGEPYDMVVGTVTKFVGKNLVQDVDEAFGDGNPHGLEIITLGYDEKRFLGKVISQSDADELDVTYSRKYTDDAWAATQRAFDQLGIQNEIRLHCRCYAW